MLVLKRNSQEKIQLGPNITIIVLDAGNGWAKIGIDAPKDVVITRPDAKRKELKR